MITLVNENKTAPRHFRGVRVVKFKDVDHIRRQLAMAAGPASTLNPTATPFIPAQATSQATAEPSVEGTGDEAEDNAIQEAAEEDGSETPEETDVAAIMESIGTDFAGISADALAEQHSAAKTLQSYYRRLLTRREERIANGLGVPKTRQNQFEEFARAAESIEWPPRSLYRPIFLGALPHLLTCLAHTRSVVMEEKRRVKRQEYQNEKHEGIEGLMEQRTKLKYVLKRLELMKSRLTDAGHDLVPRSNKLERSKRFSELHRISTRAEISNSWESI